MEGTQKNKVTGAIYNFRFVKIAKGEREPVDKGKHPDVTICEVTILCKGV